VTASAAIDRHFRLRLGRVWEEIRITRCPVEPVPGTRSLPRERERELSASSSAIAEPWESTVRSDVTARLQCSMRFTRVVCPDDRAVGVVESRALMRRSSCQGGTRSSSVARCSI